MKMDDYKTIEEILQDMPNLEHRLEENLRRAKERELGIDQDYYFANTKLHKCEIESSFSGRFIAYRSLSGEYYRIDHFDNLYVIEYADNLEEAMNNRFEDTDCFADELTDHELLLAIHTWIFYFY